MLWLQLEGSEVDPNQLLNLASRTRIQRLELLSDPVTDRHLEALRGMNDLRVIRFDPSHVSEKGFIALATLQKLREIRLGDNSIYGVIDNASFARLGSLKRLELLRLDGKGIKRSGWQALASLARLKDLAISNLTEGDYVCELLGQNCPHIESIRFTDSQMTDRGLESLQRCSKLISVDLSGTQIEGTGFCKSERWPNLQILDLYGCPISSEGLQAISRLPAIKSLYLDGEFTDEEIAALDWPESLESIRFAQASLGAKGLRHLASLPRIEGIWCENNTYDAETAAEIRKTYPRLGIDDARPSPE